MPTTESTTPQAGQNHDRDRDREMVRAITEALVLAVGKRAAHQELRRVRARAGRGAHAGPSTPPRIWRGTARSSATSGTTGGHHTSPEPDHRTSR